MMLSLFGWQKMAGNRERERARERKRDGMIVILRRPAGSVRFASRRISHWYARFNMNPRFSSDRPAALHGVTAGSERRTDGQRERERRAARLLNKGSRPELVRRFPV